MMKNHSRRNPFYVVIGLSGLAFVGTLFRPDSTPAFQALMVFFSAAYAGLVGHHFATKGPAGEADKP